MYVYIILLANSIKSIDWTITSPLSFKMSLMHHHCSPGSTLKAAGLSGAIKLCLWTSGKSKAVKNACEVVIYFSVLKTINREIVNATNKKVWQIDKLNISVTSPSVNLLKGLNVKVWLVFAQLY